MTHASDRFFTFCLLLPTLADLLPLRYPASKRDAFITNIYQTLDRSAKKCILNSLIVFSTDQP